MSAITPPSGPWSTSGSTVWGAPYDGETAFTVASFAQQIGNVTSGAIVNSLTFWTNSANEEGPGWICGITLGLTDNTQSTVGYTTGTGVVAGTKFNLARGEKITSFIACVGPNTYNPIVWSGVNISTSKGRGLVAGTYVDPNPTYSISLVNVDGGSGFLAGFYGTYAAAGSIFGSSINQFGVLFIARLGYIDVGVTDYQPDPTNTNNNLNVVALSSVQYSDPGPWTFSGSITRTASTAYTSDLIETFGRSASVEVSGSLFGIGASASASLEWSSTAQSGMSAEVSEEISLEWGTSGELPADDSQQVICTAVVSQGVLSLTYDSTVTFNFIDSTIPPVAILQSGSFSNVSFSSVAVHTNQFAKGSATEAAKATIRKE